MCGARTLITFNIKDHLPENQIAVVFLIKRSKKITETIDRINKLDGYKEIGTGRNRYAILSLPKNKAYRIQSLMNKLSHRVDYFLYVDRRKSVSNSFLTNPAICIYHCERDGNPDAYCYGIGRSDLQRQPNLVGCRQMELHIGWQFNFSVWGHFEDIFGNYLYDKERKIKQVTALLHKYRFCPYLQKDVVENFLRVWPERINVNLDKRIAPINNKDITMNITGNELSKQPGLSFDTKNFISEEEDNDSPTFRLPTNPGYLKKNPIYITEDYYFELANKIYSPESIKKYNQIIRWVVLEIMLSLSKYNLLNHSNTYPPDTE